MVKEQNGSDINSRKLTVETSRSDINGINKKSSEINGRNVKDSDRNKWQKGRGRDQMIQMIKPLRQRYKLQKEKGQ